MADKNFFFFGSPSPKLGPDPTFQKSGFDALRPDRSVQNVTELIIQLGLQKSKDIILKNTMEAQRFIGPQSEAPLKRIGTSMLGTKVVSNLSIRGASYQDQNGNTIGEYSDIIIDQVLMDVSTSNHLVISEAQGRDWDIVEYIRRRSPRITIQGVLQVREPGYYPYNAFTNLVAMANENKSVRVDSWYLNLFGIYNMVIQNFSAPQDAGGEEYQKFEIQAIADHSVVLRIQK